jgi:GDP-L-fucose synthase
MGDRGLVGSSLKHILTENGYHNVIGVNKDVIDLRDPVQTKWWMEHNKPDYVFLVAARVGGIQANDDKPVEFLTDNLRIELNVISSAASAGVKKLVFLGSSCIYPREASNPIKPEALMTGALEETNRWYALAKIAGIYMCQAYARQWSKNFVSVMPTNVYGPGDTYANGCHVIPGITRKMVRARETGAESLQLLGTGRAIREFIYVDDLSWALLTVMNKYGQDRPINIGTGTSVSIRVLASMIKEIVGYKGDVLFEQTRDSLVRDDGTPCKDLDSSEIRALGWEPQTTLHDGLVRAYQDFCDRGLTNRFSN